MQLSTDGLLMFSPSSHTVPHLVGLVRLVPCGAWAAVTLPVASALTFNTHLLRARCSGHTHSLSYSLHLSYQQLIEQPFWLFILFVLGQALYKVPLGGKDYSLPYTLSVALPLSTPLRAWLWVCPWMLLHSLLGLDSSLAVFHSLSSCCPLPHPPLTYSLFPLDPPYTVDLLWICCFSCLAQLLLTLCVCCGDDTITHTVKDKWWVKAPTGATGHLSGLSLQPLQLEDMAEQPGSQRWHHAGIVLLSQQHILQHHHLTPLHTHTHTRIRTQHCTHNAQNSAPAGKQQQEKCPGQQGHHHAKMLRHSCVCAWQRERKQRHRKKRQHMDTSY